MRNLRIWRIVLLTVLITVISGCVSEEQYNDMKAQNRIQQDRIAEFESETSASGVKFEQLQKQLQTEQGQSTVAVGSKDAEIVALEADIADKKALIARMQNQLLRSGAVLPMELSVMLKDFAGSSEMVTFDESTGVLKFKSDLLFDSGSDRLKPKSIEAVGTLCKILNGKEAKGFDVIIAGHTDDVPIRASRVKHSTNWHLSVHRAISVLNLMTKNKVVSKRVSVRGFGEYRPAAPNKPNKGGNAANRRVEIFIVPAGV